MLRYSLRRLLHSIPVIAVMSVVVFSVILLVPGDPVLSSLGGQEADPAAVAKLRHDFGLDQPVPVQYLRWVDRAVLHGDLGKSVSTQQPVLNALVERLPVTLELALLATLLAMVIAFPLGVIAALRRNGLWDTILSTSSVTGLAIPSFFVAILMVIVFAVNLKWLPASGYVPFGESPLENLKHMLMPSVALAFPFSAVLMRQVRASMIEVMSQDFVRTARAKGVSELRVVTRHAVPNGLIAPVTVLGLHIAHLLGGVLIIETIFRIPGTGSLAVGAIFQRDFQVVQGGALLIGLVTITMNFVVDLLYATVDPRITEARA